MENSSSHAGRLSSGVVSAERDAEKMEQNAMLPVEIVSIGS
jgi:hypothetical protein